MYNRLKDHKFKGLNQGSDMRNLPQFQITSMAPGIKWNQVESPVKLM